MNTNYIAPLSDKQTEQAATFILNAPASSVEINATTAAEVLQAGAYAAKHLHQLLEIIRQADERASSALAGVTAQGALDWADNLQSMSDEQYLQSSDEVDLFSTGQLLTGASAGLSDLTICFNAIGLLAESEEACSLSAQIARAGYCFAGDAAKHLAGVAGAFYSAHEGKGGIHEH